MDGHPNVPYLDPKDGLSATGESAPTVEADSAEGLEPGDGARAAAHDRIASFWQCGPTFDQIKVNIAPPERPHELLEKLGPSPFARGGFPLIGFLATTYDKISRITVEGE